MKKDKYDIVFEVMEANDCDIEDLAKLLCSVFHWMNDAIDVQESKITKVIYGSGKKFELTIDMRLNKK